ncbi:MAG: amidohydrolase [Clostridia bacterium]|nr:amidohydrolase [Clostridia bacterium]
MTTEGTAVAPAAGPVTTGSVPQATALIDADIHPDVRGELKGLKPYLSAAWYRRFEEYRGFRLPTHPMRPPLPGGGANRRDVVTPDGRPGAEDPLFVRADHLDRHGIACAVMVSIQAGKVAALSNAGEAAVLARAFNDYFLHEWVAVDPRFRLAMCVAPHDPREAAREIDRIGGEKGVVAVFMPLINILMGNPHYHPIYEAAEAHGLPIVVHPTGTEGGFAASVVLCGGLPTTYIERHTAFPEIAMANILNLVFEGVFERFPRLQVLFSEFGYGWVPDLMWRMDANWRNFRPEVPWLQKPPSRYLLDHIRFTTQPIPEPEKDQYLLQILEMVHADRTLVFSTDYPHWDNDFPDHHAFSLMPETLKQHILHDNAAALFRLAV